MILPEDTPVKLRLDQNLSSADATEGQGISFTVVDAVRLSGLIVIPNGAVAHGTITEAQAKRRMGRGGKLDMNIDYVRLANGDKLMLRGVRNAKGGGHGGAMTGAIVATSLVLWPAAPLFLLMHGKDIKIPEGTEITVFTSTEYDVAAHSTLSHAAQDVAAVPAPKQ